MKQTTTSLETFIVKWFFWSLNLLIGVCRNVPISKLCDDNDETIETTTIEEMDN